MYFNDRDFGVAAAVMACICGVIGWGVIETLLWIIGNLSVSWGGQ